MMLDHAQVLRIPATFLASWSYLMRPRNGLASMQTGLRLVCTVFFGATLFLAGGANARDLAIQGGPGGAPFRIACSINDFLVSISIRRGAWVDAIRGHCDSYVKETHELVSVLGTYGDLSFQGGVGGTLAADVCPKHTYISGLRYGFTRDGNRPKWLDFVEFTCTPIPAAGAAAGPQVTRCLQSGDGCWARHPNPGNYNGYGLTYESRCAPNEAVSGLVGRSGRYVDALGAICTPRPE
jgi:hypothetical protein